MNCAGEASGCEIAPRARILANVAIVVGVDGSSESRQALRWALTEASYRRTSLHVVWVLHPAMEVEHIPPIGPLVAAPIYVPSEEERDEVRRRTEQQLESIVAKVEREMPEAADVPIERVVVAGHPAEMLLDAASGAELLVVGSRGRGGFAGLLLGSVSQTCAHHANCPVVIVRRHE